MKSNIPDPHPAAYHDSSMQQNYFWLHARPTSWNKKFLQTFHRKMISPRQRPNSVNLFGCEVADANQWMITWLQYLLLPRWVNKLDGSLMVLLNCSQIAHVCCSDDLASLLTLILWSCLNWAQRFSRKRISTQIYAPKLSWNFSSFVDAHASEFVGLSASPATHRLQYNHRIWCWKHFTDSHSHFLQRTAQICEDFGTAHPPHHSWLQNSDIQLAVHLDMPVLAARNQRICDRLDKQHGLQIQSGKVLRIPGELQ